MVGADAIFACLGPALVVYSRYSRVEKISVETMELREYLEPVWSVVAREALATVCQNAETEGLQEDARLSAIWLWTLTGSSSADSEVEQGAGEDGEDADDGENNDARGKTMSEFSLEYDIARKIAHGLGVRLDKLEHVIEVKCDNARLQGVSERANYLLVEATKSTEWMVCCLAKRVLSLADD